jgi:hypothetical protein
VAAEVAVGTTRGVGMGDATIIGVGLSNGAGARVRVSGSLGAGVALSIGSGVALASGLSVALGDGFVVAAGVVFGLAVGVGVSSETVGVRGWNGVEAASCARTNAAVASSTIASTNERMSVVSPGKIPSLGR